MLTDNNFRWFSRMSTVHGGQDAVNKAQPVISTLTIRFLSMLIFQFLWFPCGLIRGALSNLGVESTVMAEVTSLGLPSVSFQIKVDSQ